ncbi:MAG: PilZ domain-containing protein [Rhodospirillales bacterium]|nr:PilZ domain-containing protein [Alphaproteobacteria bacterium]MCB9981585.1 PilZ domain-containing protein [Rhodospirillales bacterium]
MFGQLFSSLKAGNSNEEQSVRRRHARRDCDRCVTVINGQTYPVENWSLGGVLISSDERQFGLEDEVGVTMRFRLRDNIIDVPHSAEVVRKTKNKVAFRFKPLTQQIRSNFQNVIDDYVASQFAASQSQFR